MNKKTIYIAIFINLLIIFALVLFLIGINRKNSGDIVITQDNSEIKEIDESLLSEYKSELLNVKFSYMKDFDNKIENVKEENTYDNVGFYSKSSGEGCTLQVYSGVKMNGHDAYKMVYRTKDNINVSELVSIVNEKQYMLLYSGNDEIFDKAKGDFLFTKFEFLN